MLLSAFLHFFIILTVISQPSPRIVNGLIAQRGDWPSQVLLGDSPVDIAALCGGSLITEEWILTAAHCFLYPFPNGTTLFNGQTLVLGEYSRSNRDGTEVFRNISWVITVSEFNITDIRKRDVDVALVRINPPVDFDSDEAKHLKPMCLVMDEINIKDLECVATGFGLAKNFSIPKELQQLQMQHIQSEECEERIREINHAGNITEDLVLSRNEVCFVSKVGGVCSGDSGGPVQCKYQNAWFQVGIAERTPQNDCIGIGIFSSVQKHAKFIQKHTGYTLPDYCTTEIKKSRGSVFKLTLSVTILSNIFLFVFVIV